MIDHRPRVTYHHGRWHCALDGDEWPRGVGETWFEAFEDWERRWLIERSKR